MQLNIYFSTYLSTGYKIQNKINAKVEYNQQIVKLEDFNALFYLKLKRCLFEK